MYPFCVFLIVEVKVLAGSPVLRAVSKGLNAPDLTFDPAVCKKSMRPKKNIRAARSSNRCYLAMDNMYAYAWVAIILSIGVNTEDSIFIGLSGCVCSIRRSETEVKPRAYFFEFRTHFSILKLDWSMKRHRQAIALAGVARV